MIDWEFVQQIAEADEVRRAFRERYGEGVEVSWLPERPDSIDRHAIVKYNGNSAVVAFPATDVLRMRSQAELTEYVLRRLDAAEHQLYHASFK